MLQVGHKFIVVHTLHGRNVISQRVVLQRAVFGNEEPPKVELENQTFLCAAYTRAEDPSPIVGAQNGHLYLLGEERGVMTIVRTVWPIEHFLWSVAVSGVVMPPQFNPVFAVPQRPPGIGPGFQLSKLES